MSSTAWPAIEARYGDGWIQILTRLAEDLKQLDPAIQITRAREKFGVLRVSTEWPAGTDLGRLRALVDAARDESARTCERCGVTGEPRTIGGYWQMTLCSSCTAYAEVAADRYCYTTGDVRFRARRVSAGAPVLIETAEGQLLELTMDRVSADAMVQALNVDGEMRWVRAGSAEQRDGALLGGMVRGLILRPYQHGAEEGRPPVRPVQQIIDQAVGVEADRCG